MAHPTGTNAFSTVLDSDDPPPCDDCMSLHACAAGRACICFREWVNRGKVDLAHGRIPMAKIYVKLFAAEAVAAE